MINISLGFTLSNRKFHFIPKFYKLNMNKIKGFVINWLTLESRVDNCNLPWYGMAKCYQLGYTMLFDSYTKSDALLDILTYSPRLKAGDSGVVGEAP